MTKKDPRSKGLTGEPLIKEKYHYLRDRGVPSDIAKSARKRTWDFIDETIALVEKGMTKNISVPSYYKTSKTVQRQTGKKQPKAKKQPAKKQTGRKKKPAAKKTKNKTPKGYKKAPEGYYYRYYKKSGKYGLVKYPETRQPKEDSGCYPRLMVFYQEVVETDGASIQSHLRKMSQRSIPYLKREINGGKFGAGWMSQDGMYIGRVRTEFAENPEQMERNLNKYPDWLLLYNDCPDPRKLLAVIATIGKYVYEPEKKESAVETLLSTTHAIDPEAGNELDNLIG